MANFRQIHTKIWKDDWFLDLSPKHKLFFIYLFSNERSSLAGIYELPVRVMSFESGLSQKEIDESFQLFSEAEKAHYNDGVVWVMSLRKYHETSSEKVQTRILRDLKEVKECELKGIYCELYGIDRVSVEKNGVSIPPYTSTYTSKSSIKGGVGESEPLAEYAEIIKEWGEGFPDKPQPRSDNRTLQGKVRTRLKSAHFRKSWSPAMSRAAQSSFLQDSPWFTLQWFLKNDDNYEKCLNGNYDNSPSPNGQQPQQTGKFEYDQTVEAGRF